ncbi:MAG: DUF3987 domain-containing protein [Deltaproteobacteria bacterium]|nr:DUF3987 domain-containing protein [Deltaproteobacteria bacterium]
MSTPPFGRNRGTDQRSPTVGGAGEITMGDIGQHLQSDFPATEHHGQSATDILQFGEMDQVSIIKASLAYLHSDGVVFEMCVIGPKPPNCEWWEGFAGGRKPIVAGWFRDHEKAAELATRVWATGVYITLNPANGGLLSRANERLLAGVGRTQDGEIEWIRNLLIDLDPIRPAGISSTDTEHAAALEMAQIIQADLTAEGWPNPLLGDSGNGAHLVFPLDLANTPESIALVKAGLVALAQRYADELKRRNLEIDQAVFNPARLTKLYGTMVRKGDNTQDRPHRLARIISLPNTRQPVPLELLKKLAATINSPENPQPRNSEVGEGRLDVEAYLRHYGVEVLMVKPHCGGLLYCLHECMFDSSHSGNEAAIFQAANGGLAYKCFHNSCKARTWAEARARISGHDKLTGFIIGGTHSKDSYQSKSKNRKTEAGEAKFSETLCPLPPPTPWNLAAQLFPRIPFPWEVLPGSVADSLQQLGRACATSPAALPGAGCCLTGSIMGRTLTVSPKQGWDSPMNTWHMDIRESGEGKTPPVHLMAGPIHEAQLKEEIRYRREMEAYKRLTRKEREQTPPPTPPRGYFVSDLTLEGLRDDLINSPHGGIVGIHDEISSFITSQNQYKPKGTDREAWLCLFDGKSARIVRAGKTMYLHGARVSIFGGVQPKVF